LGADFAGLLEIMMRGGENIQLIRELTEEQARELRYFLTAK
jgi:hypothetical protein